MMYSVIFEKQVYRQLKKLDPFTAFMIRNWISKNLEGSNDPRSHGKALQGSLLALSNRKLSLDCPYC